MCPLVVDSMNFLQTHTNSWVCCKILLLQQTHRKEKRKRGN